MAIHQSSVDFRNLIQNLAEMYPYEIEEIVVVETIANALDAKAEEINISFDQSKNVLVIQDNGKGMDKDTFRKYHDFSVSLKTRGSGIGFAGLGAKIAFNSAARVVTETRSPNYQGGSNWYLRRGALIWEDIPVQRILGTGTYVEIHFGEGNIPAYRNTEEIISIIERNYSPLFVKQLCAFYSTAGTYSSKLHFYVNKVKLPVISMPGDMKMDNFRPVLLTDRKGTKRGIGYFGLAARDLTEEERGIALCTYGKVIKREFLNIYPSRYTDRIMGIIEIPQLIMCITASKTDLNKKSKKWRLTRPIYEKAQDEFKNWLNELGALPTVRVTGVEAGKLERTVREIIKSFPEIEDFFTGSYRKKDIFAGSGSGEPASLMDEIQGTLPGGELGSKGSESISGGGLDEGERMESDEQGEKKGVA